MAPVRDIVDASEVTVTCPTCSAASAHTIGTLRAQRQFLCIVCQDVVPLDFTEFERTVAALQSELDHLFARGTPPH